MHTLVHTYLHTRRGCTARTVEALLRAQGNGAVRARPTLLTRACLRQRAVAVIRTLAVLHIRIAYDDGRVNAAQCVPHVDTICTKQG